MSQTAHSSQSRTAKKASDSNARQHASGEASFMPPTDGDANGHFGDTKNDDMVAKAATIAVVGVGVALLSTELIPGMLIGVAAAMLPGIGPKMRPFLKSTVKAGYSAVRKTREMVAEASEQMQDMIAEARAEESEPGPSPAHAKSKA